MKTLPARQAIQDLTPYQSARRIGGQGEIFLNANESPFSVPYTLSSNTFNRYPDCQPAHLLQAYAYYAHLAPEQLLITRGADEGIQLLIQTFCEPGKDQVLFCPPTYGMYAVSAATLGVKAITIPLKEDWQLNLTAIAAQLAEVKLIFICNPNNPTGTLLRTNDLLELLTITKQHALVVIDEAYIEFYPTASFATVLNHHANLVILRTLSKAFSLAGLRCGFTLAHPELIQSLLKVIAPYPIATPVADIAVQSLQPEALVQMQHNTQMINQIKNQLSQQLLSIPCVKTVYPSVANYLLVQFKQAEYVFNTLWQQGIIVRNQSQQLNLGNCLRISIGQLKECQTLLNVLQNLATNDKERKQDDAQIPFY